MPEKATLERAKKDKREGKAPSTQAGEFVREEIEHIREASAVRVRLGNLLIVRLRFAAPAAFLIF